MAVREGKRKKYGVRIPSNFGLDFGERRKRTSWRSSERREIRESRIELYKKTGNFLNGRRDARLRHSSFCGAFSVVMFSVGLFPVPLVRCDFLEGAPLLLPSTPLPNRKEARQMKLYKTISEESAIDYLQTGKLEVELADGAQGVISFQSEIMLHMVNKHCVILEFDVRNESTLYGSRRPLSDGRFMELIRSHGCDENSEQKWTHKLGDDFRLVSITILPKCGIDWRFVRLCLKAAGNDDTSIKVMREWTAVDSFAAVYIDEEYLLGSDGLFCLKYNPNHPHDRDKIHVKDVE